MKAEAFYLLAMLDYLSKRNGLPKCNEYEEIRRYKLEELYDSTRSSESDNRVILQAFWRLQKERGSENLRNEIKKF